MIKFVYKGKAILENSNMCCNTAWISFSGLVVTNYTQMSFLLFYIPVYMLFIPLNSTSHRRGKEQGVQFQFGVLILHPSALVIPNEIIIKLFFKQF